MKSPPERFIKARLIERGVSLTEIARRSGETLETVSHVIRGKRTNRADPILREIAKAADLKLGDLRAMYPQSEAA